MTPAQQSIWAGAVADIGNIWTRSAAAPRGLMPAGNLQRAFTRNLETARLDQEGAIRALRAELYRQQIEANQRAQQQAVEDKAREVAMREAYLQGSAGGATEGRDAHMAGLREMIPYMTAAQLRELGKTLYADEQSERPMVIPKDASVLYPGTREIVQMPGAGSMDPVERAKLQDTFIKQYGKQSEDFAEVSQYYRTLMNAPATGAGDTVTVKMFEKILDPGSVVQANEAAAIGQAAGILERWKGTLSEVGGWGKLSETARQELRDAITVAYNIRLKNYQEDLGPLNRRIEQANLRRENIYREITPYEPPGTGQSGLKPGDTVTAPQGQDVPPGFKPLPDRSILDSIFGGP